MDDILLHFPHESAIVTLRSIELGAASSLLLVCHCAYICVRFSSSLADRLDVFLLAAGALRLLLSLPRPLYWLRMHRMYREARYLPTPQHVSRRLQQLRLAPPGSEAALVVFFHAWLGSMLLLLWLQPRASPFSAAMWGHLKMNLGAIAAVRVAVAGMFMWLQQLDFRRGVPADVLDSYTALGAFCGAEGEDCAICYAAFEEGARVRTLACKHYYHASCVDEWLLQKQNRCPLCQRVVGPEGGGRRSPLPSPSASSSERGGRFAAAAWLTDEHDPVSHLSQWWRQGAAWRRGTPHHGASCQLLPRSSGKVAAGSTETLEV